MPDSSSDADVTLDSSSSIPVVETASTPVILESTEPTSVLDAVEAALKPDGVEAGSPPAETGQTKPKTEPNGSEPAKDENDVSEEEMKTFSPNAQARIRDLAAQKNELRSTVENMTAEMEPLKAKARSFETLTGYLVKHGIDAREANNALEITRLIKGQDYDRALQIVAPIYQELAKRTGGVLDTDLQEDVRLGHIPLARAKEIQRGRAVEATTNEREQSRAKADERNQQESEQQALVTHVHTMAQAADDWAKTKADADPDWNQKQDLVAAQVNLIVSREGFPKTKAALTDINERALKSVEEKLKPLLPRMKAIDPARPTGSASPRDLPAPKTALEALERGLEQA